MTKRRDKFAITETSGKYKRRRRKKRLDRLYSHEKHVFWHETDCDSDGLVCGCPYTSPSARATFVCGECNANSHNLCDSVVGSSHSPFCEGCAVGSVTHVVGNNTNLSDDYLRGGGDDELLKALTELLKAHAAPPAYQPASDNIVEDKQDKKDGSRKRSRRSAGKSKKRAPLSWARCRK